VKQGDILTITYDDGTGMQPPSVSPEGEGTKAPQMYTLSGKRIAHEQKGCVMVQKGKKYIRKG